MVLGVASVLVALGLIAPAPAAAEGTPNISLDKNAPETALLGTKQKVQLVAKNPAGEKRGYNLTFRDVLPKGVAYVPGSSEKVPPRILENQPAVGMTTLIFENVADLSANSDYELTYEVEPSTSFFKLTEEHVYTNNAEAFAGEEPRKLPRFNEKGEVIAGSFTGNDPAEATTELTAIEIEKSEPSPEGEILRGVHEHQTVYTLTVRNNEVGETVGVAGLGPEGKPAFLIEDWLPAGLEFLGCGKVDNTTDTFTNPGSAEEYPGSGPINPGNAPATKNCVEPFYAKAELTTPPGGRQPEGIYTHVKFLGPESLPAGGKYELQYIAAIPIRQNTGTWEGSAEPSAEGLGQIANLNNNNGPETFDEEELTNVAQAQGEYESVPVQDTGEMTRTAEDLAIQKDTDPKQTKIFDGAETNWTLRLETSEYRRTEPVSITDQLPDGLCPRGPKNYEGPAGGPITEPKFECEASATLRPTVKYLKGGPAGKGGTEEQIEYSLAEEETKGGFKLEFNGPEVEALKRLEPSQELLITFPTTTRTFFQDEFKDANPVLTGDSWMNEVKTEAPAFSRCVVAPAQPDPNCEQPGAKPIVEELVTGTPVGDVSAAGQEAGGVEIEKAVRENNGPVPTFCKEAPSGEFVKGIVSPKEPTLPQYRPGDEICWRLVVKFAADLYAGTPVVSDFIPPDEEYVQGSQEAGVANTVEDVEFNKKAAIEEEALEWTLGKGESVEKELRFEYLFKTRVSVSPKTDPGEVTGNLMKFLSSNTKGETFPLRDRAEVQRQEPALSLEKGITEVGGKTVVGGPKSGVTVGGGEKVKYELDVKNAGNLDAEEAEVWDVLPEGIECSDVTLPAQTAPQAASCAEGFIRWTGVAVPEGGGFTALTYEVVVPTDVAPGHPFINHAGVARYKSQTNTTLEKFEYIPAENINKKLTESNTGPLLAKAEIKTNAASLQKEATSETTQSGNGAREATIGEIVDYKVTATIPANSKIYGTPVVKDVLPTTLALVPGTVEAELDGQPLTFEGVSLESLVNGAEVKFNGAYPTTPGAEHTLVIRLKAMVRNIAANKRGETLTNGASFEFEDVTEAGPTVLTETVGTPVVEPELEVQKNLIPAGRSTTVAPGEVVEYETVVSNASGLGISTANEVEVVDTIPAGMTIVDPGGGSPVGNTIVWHLGAIAPGTTKNLIYKLEVIKPATAASSFTNVVVGKTQSLPAGLSTETREAGFKEGAYEAAEEGYEKEDANTVRLVGATVSKEVTPGEATIGSELTYTLHMNLPPEIKYFNTTMVDQLPKGLTFDELIGAPECESEGESCGSGSELPTKPGSELHGWYFGEFFEAGPARVLTVKFKAHVNPEATEGELVNHLAGSYNNSDKGEPTELPVPGSESPLFNEETEVAPASLKVLEPHLELTKAVSGAVNGKALPGGTLEYTLTVKNTGTWDAYDFNVEDEPSANLTGFVLGTVEGGTATQVSTNPPVWHVDGPLARNGGEMKFHYTAKLVESKDLKNEEKVENHAKVPIYFGLPPAERKPGRFEKYGPLEAEQELKVEVPQITLEKSVGTPGQEKADVGVGFKWQIVVKNTAANAGAKEAVVEDELPAKWTYKAGSATVNGTALEPTIAPAEPRKLTWTLAELNQAEEVTFLFEAIPAPGATEGLNGAIVHAKDEAGGEESKDGPYEAEDTAMALIVAPEFAVEKTPDGAVTIAGEPAEYKIKVTNVGNGDALLPIEVSDELGPEQTFIGPGTLPSGVSFVSVNPVTGLGPARIEWTIAALKAGESIEIPVPIAVPSEVDEGGTIKDLAEVGSPQAPTVEKDEGSFLVEREVDLSIEKTAVQEDIKAGEVIEYELKVENHGPSDATEIVVTDPLPETTSFVGADPGCSEAGGIVTCELAELKFGAPAHVFKFSVEVQSETLGFIENTATVGGKQPEPETGGFPNESTVKTPIGGLANLSIVKTGPEKPVLLGNTFTYKLAVENKGPSNAMKVEVEDALPEQVKFLSATPSVGTCEALEEVLTCQLGSMLPKAAATIEVTVEAIEVGNFENLATVTSETLDTHLEDNGSEAPAEIVPAADLTIGKTAPGSVEPDGTLTYSLHVENHGPSVAHMVLVTDPLPAGVDFVSASEDCTAAGTKVTCAVLDGELAVGDSADFQITVHVPFALGGQALANTATVGAEEGDPHPEDNSSTVTTDVGPAADLSITKTMGKAEAGQPLTYTLAVTNKGPSASSTVTVKDTLPAGTSFKSAASSQGTCTASGQMVTCELGQLAAGGSAQVSITVEVAATATGSLRNVATVEGPLPDPDKSNDASAVEGPVEPSTATAPNLKVVKTADTQNPTVGTPFDYNVAVTNVSGGEAKNAKVVDTLNGPVKVVSLEAESGHCSAAGSKITCSIPSIPVGKTVRITYSVIAEAAGPLSNTASAEAANGEKVPSNNHAVKSVKAKSAKGTFSLTKTATRKVVPGGKKVGFTITLRNGAAALTDAKICDRLPAALVFVKAAGARYVNGEACWKKKYVAAHRVLRLHLLARAVKGYNSRQARNVATASAANVSRRRSAAATVRVKPALAGKPGGVTG